MKLSETAAKLIRERFYDQMRPHIIPSPADQFKDRWERLVQVLMELDFLPLPPSQSELDVPTESATAITKDSILGIAKFKK